jgi:hypothetical protein
MQGERKLWGLVIFIQLACGQTGREFGTKQAGAAGGVSGWSGAAAGGKSGALGVGGHANTGTSGSSADDGPAGSGGDVLPGMCVVDLDCASQPHVRAGAPAKCSQGKCSIPASSCEEGYGHCSDSELEFCETSLTTVSDCGSCGQCLPQRVAAVHGREMRQHVPFRQARYLRGHVCRQGVGLSELRSLRRVVSIAKRRCYLQQGGL